MRKPYLPPLDGTRESADARIGALEARHQAEAVENALHELGGVIDELEDMAPKKVKAEAADLAREGRSHIDAIVNARVVLDEVTAERAAS